MAGCDTVEDMEVDKDEVVIFLSVKWSESIQQQESKMKLQKVLQTWASSAKDTRECTVLDVSEDGKVVLKIEPPPAVKELQKLIGQTLSKKDWGKKKVTITSVSLTSPELETPKPEEASVDLPPASDVKELQELNGQTLSKKDKKTVTMTSVSPTPSKLGTTKPEKASGDLLPLSKPEPQDLTTSPPDEQEKKISHRPEDASVDLPPSSEPQDVQMPPLEEINLNSSAAASTAGEETCSCSLPVNHFCYVNHIYKKEIKEIKKKNGVAMEAEVTVTFKANQKDGGPQEALSEFINLVQKCLGESEGSAFPLEYAEPGELKDALRIIQRPENKILLTLSSEEMIICGPRQSQDAISQSLNLTQKTLRNTITSAEESTRMSEDPPLNIDMSIKDPLVDTGLIMEESYWELIRTSYFEKVSKIKVKFDVDFKVSGINQGKVKVKAQYKRSGQNVSMESHAIRALLRLYQEIVTSPKNFPKLLGSMGVRGPPENWNNVHQSEGASSGPALNGQSENSMCNTAPENLRNTHQSEGAFSGPALNDKSKYSTHNTDAPSDEGATAGDKKDENCPICMDTLTKKTQLKCKHEFCEECLEQSKKTMGSICPVCREVFGMIEGDQPDGYMSWIPSYASLPGYSNCGSITITYDIPSGKQTEKHPNPGQFYSGIHRTAYLPDNEEGREVLKLLKEAFDRKLIFTVGTSRTTGRDNQVTWNDIHHKTSPSGGPQNFGYPDSDYLKRVRDELKAKGIK